MRLTAIRSDAVALIPPAAEIEQPSHTWISGGQAYVACAFYTDNYLPSVLALKQSLEKLGINHHLQRVDASSTWESNTRLKTAFVKECLKRFPKHHVLYVDADSIIRQPLGYLDTVATDVSFCVFNKPIRGRHCLQVSGGTVFVRNTDGGRRFASEWAKADGASTWLTTDEDLLHMAFSNLEGVTFTVQPKSYYKVFDAPASQAPVIEHFQASRKQFKWTRLLRNARRWLFWLSLAAFLAFVAIRAIAANAATEPVSPLRVLIDQHVLG